MHRRVDACGEGGPSGARRKEEREREAGTHDEAVGVEKEAAKTIEYAERERKKKKNKLCTRFCEQVQV